MRSRVFNILQYEVNPQTGESLNFDESNIIAGLDHKTIKRWAYICHDVDVYSERDESDGIGIAGESKGRHWHIVLSTGNSAVECGMIARWFGIPENMVDVPKGHGAFLDCVQYLTHEHEAQQELGKRLYPDSAVAANFDFRTELAERAARKLKYGRDLSIKDRFRYDVLYNGKTLGQCMEEDKINYMNDIDRLKKLRLEYISTQDPPKSRVNYYIYGKGGIGKDMISRAIARSLFPGLSDDDIFFNVGASGVAFDGYDGQPVLIWSDRRAKSLLRELGGRENLYNVFDTHPPKQRQSIKFGNVNLCNLVNIVNGQETYVEFLDNIAGDLEDKGQSYRRFPMIIPLRSDDFDILLNRGYMEGTDNFLEYLEYTHIRGNMQRIANYCGKNEKLARELEAKLVSPIAQHHAEIVAVGEQQLDDAEIRELFESYGKPIYPSDEAALSAPSGPPPTAETRDE